MVENPKDKAISTSKWQEMCTLKVFGDTKSNFQHTESLIFLTSQQNIPDVNFTTGTLFKNTYV